MKKFTKVMLIIAGVFASIGVISMVVAFSMGLTSDYLKEMVQNGQFSFDEGDLHISFDDDFDNDIDVDANIQVETELEDGKISIYEIKEPCHSMDIQFGAGILDVYYDDVECIQVKQKNIKEFKVGVKNDTLVISEGTDVKIDIDDVEDRRLTIVIPNQMQFQEVELESGASKADIKDIQSENLSVTVGAGQADISKIAVKQFDLEVGAGQATVTQLSVDKLDVEAGVGRVNIALNGVQGDYNYKVECGIGNVQVGTSSYSGLGSEHEVKYDGVTKEIKVECGIGEVKIEFQD